MSYFPFIYDWIKSVAQITRQMAHTNYKLYCFKDILCNPRCFSDSLAFVDKTQIYLLHPTLKFFL